MHANRSTLPSIRKCQGPHSIKANVVTHVRHLFGRKPQTQGFRMDDIAILPVLLAQVRNNPSMPEPERSPSVLVQTSTSVPRTMSLGHWSRPHRRYLRPILSSLPQDNRLNHCTVLRLGRLGGVSLTVSCMN